MNQKKTVKKKSKPMRFVGRAFVIEDHSGLSLRTLRATRDASIKEITKYTATPWKEMKEVCKCIQVELYAKERL